MAPTVSRRSRFGRPLWPAAHVLAAVVLGAVIVLLDVWQPLGLSVSPLYALPPLYLIWAGVGRTTWYLTAALTALVFLVPWATDRSPSHRITGAAVALLLIYAISERRRLINELGRANSELECRVSQQTASLRVSEQRFSLFMQHLPGLAWIKDSLGRYVYVNDAAEKAFRRPRTQLYGKTDDEIFPPETAAEFKEADRRVLASGAEVRTIETLAHEDGVLRHSLVSKFPLHDQSDSALLIGGVAIDITERLHAEVELRRSEARLRGLIDAIPDLIFRLDRDGRIVDAKAQLSDDLLVPPVDFLGKTHREIMPAHVSDQFDQAALMSAHTSRPQEFEYELDLPDGRRQWFEARVVRIACGDSVVVVRNVTDQKQSEAALRESENRFRQLAENIREVFWIATADNGRVEYVSPAYEELTGRTCASLYAEALSWLKSVHPDDREWVAAGLSRQADDGYDCEYRVVRPDGSVRWVRDRSFPVRNERGDVERIVGLAEDISERKQAEEELRDSQERLRMAVEAANLGTWDWNVRTNEVAFSREWKRQIGYEDHELAPRYEEWENRLHPDDRQRVLAALQSYLDGTASEYSVEFRLRNKDGTYRWINTRGTALRDAEGKIVHILGCHADVTARKQTEALVRGQKRVLELVASGAPLTSSLNELVRLVEGHTDGMHCSILLLDWRGMHLRHSVAPSLPAEYVAAIDGVTIGPSVGSCGTAAFRREPVFVQDIATDPLWRDYRDLALAHGLRACWSMPIFDAQRQVLGTFAMYYHQPALPTPEERALIEMATHTAGIAICRHRMETTLRESESRLRSVLEDVENVAVQAYELDGTITFWNKPSERLYGYTAAEALGRDLVELLHGEATREDERRLMEQIAGTGIAPAADEVPVVTRDGRRRWVLASRVLHTRPGRPPEFFCFDVDITDRKRAEEELAVRQAELLHASRLSTLGQMVSALSHEVAQPLSAVGNFAAASGRLLATQPGELLPFGPLDSLRSYIEAIVKQNERCGEILRRLRDFSRRGESQRTDCDVNLVLHESVDLIAHDLRRQDVVVKFQLAESLPAVVVDRVQLEQVLVNLLTNARDAVCTLPTDRRMIQISSRAVDEGVAITVDDHGVGFTDEVKAHLFEPFFTTKERGMGIGLNICQTIIQEHGGRIEAANNCWGGATISVWLP